MKMKCVNNNDNNKYENKSEENKKIMIMCEENVWIMNIVYENNIIIWNNVKKENNKYKIWI